ncbi:MAG: hypothetical protein CL808_07555 [Citromicrobium sp.]|nr:hypothetical protein [Citromicrobium sp.]|tara:strand:- start:794 stop:1375 length:582 start_codon:yes stop_codon:yes gene_type:complete
MNGKRDVTAILEFQDYQSEKGLLTKATAGARKAALGKVLGILDGEEAADVTAINLDDVMMRFSNLEGRTYTPGSLKTYKSRVASALEDFSRYLENPLGFRPSINKRSTKSAKQQASKQQPSKQVQSATKSEEDAGQQATPQKTANTHFEAATILPIPLRQNLIVRIQGLPFDMTASEAKKIANVVIAMATQEE